MKRFTTSLVLTIMFFAAMLFAGCNVVDDIRGNNDDDEESTSSLHPVLLNGEWGFINNEGSLEISPQFESVRDFENGFAAFRRGTSWGFISESSRQVIVPATFNFVGNFAENGLTPAQNLGENYGFINTNGEFAIPAQFDLALEFSENRAPVRIDGLWGYIDENGAQAIEVSFSDARPFSEGLAAVETFDGWVYVNADGGVEIDPTFQITAAREFNDGLAAIQTAEGWGFIDVNGTPIINPDYDAAGEFSEGRAWLRDDDYIGFIDVNGEFVIEPQFAEAKSFSESLAPVRLSSNWYYVNRNTGLLQFSSRFEEAEPFNNGLARVNAGSDENPAYGYIDKNGEYVWYPTR